MPNSFVWDSSLSQYRIFGSQTPAAFTDKRRHVPEPDIPSTAAVFIDVLRATTTLLAIGAAGARGIFVDIKPKVGEYPFDPPPQLAHLKPWVFGGELNGSPVTGIDTQGNPVVGVIGNSPIDARREVFEEKYLRFFSTNGSSILQAVIDGGMPVICAMAMANIEATVDYVLAESPNRVWFTCGGFYGSSTLEDSVAAGIAIEMLIARGFATEDELDDEARSMVYLGRYFSASLGLRADQLLEKLTQSQVGLMLANIGRVDDIAASVSGAGIDEEIRTAMRSTVLRVDPAWGPFLLPIKVGGLE